MRFIRENKKSQQKAEKKTTITTKNANTPTKMQKIKNKNKTCEYVKHRATNVEASHIL